MLFSISLFGINNYSIYSYSLSLMSLMWSTENINSILGIILMVLSIINILYTAIRNIYNAIKNKNYDKVSEEITDTIEKIENVKEEINKDVDNK